ncbi:McrC family protein [Streptomyces longwoodensis]|uniref:McrC family protein n=1 Tax=Streptomyces longwoodensis TaxID=68231 RepID=UPI002251411C|nr:restriction endonuclease [Streptomyces longwoodensis]MCX4998893.1 McrC family protein [Streptomyces longwoodensis]
MTSTSRLDLVEHGGWVTARLSPATGRRLAESGVVEVRPDPYDATSWDVRALGKVGAVRIAGVDVSVAPKLPVRRLFFLVGYAADPTRGWHTDEEPVDTGSHEGLVPALAHAFERLADRALRQGLLQGYRTVEDALPVVRGRVRTTEQMQRRYGSPFPVEVTYDDFTADIPENQLLRAAAERLLRLPRIPVAVRHRLLRLVTRLTDASPLVAGRPLPQWRPSRLNHRYHAPCRFAELILDGTSVEHRRGGVRVDGFLFDLAKVFEDFVSTALTQALRAYGGHCRTQARHYLDEASDILMKPDLVHYSDDGVPRAVVDAKYKAERPAGFPGGDLYQMLAYCTALGLPTGHLVYAKGNEPQVRHTIRGAGTVIVQHALELDEEPARVLEEVARVAACLAVPIPNEPCSSDARVTGVITQRTPSLVSSTRALA